ncbi:RHS repeat-associated core domain-containing protein [Vibrio mediterranei]|nr:RHS repeat-associated core domain-containing protein [Vibrio mediterranei]NOI26757.1 RHS repeat-associated core domain-containing protein [Vibrio mediterranei]
MKNLNANSLSQRPFNTGRRKFLGQAGAVTATTLLPVPGIAQSASPSLKASPLIANPNGFNGERKDPVTGCYHLGIGYRMYNPRLMRFHAADSMSPFGKGGINSYAYCLGDPVNKRDPSGHFAIISLIIGAIVGAVVGAGISAAAEGIRAAASGDSFDWKQIGIGAALGFISGGFGAAAVGAKTSVQVGLAVADTVVSGAADFGMNVASGASLKNAGINAGIGTVVGLAGFGAGLGAGKLAKSIFPVQRMAKSATSKGVITLGGYTRDVINIAEKSATFVDSYKYRPRLNVVAHGNYLRPINGTVREASTLSMGSKVMSAKDTYKFLLQNYELRKYKNIRVLSCYSANGGENSFGQKLSNLTGARVKAYEGPVSFNMNIRPEMEHKVMKSSKYNYKPVHFNPDGRIYNPYGVGVFTV